MPESQFLRPDPLANERFQDFLADQELMNRGNLDPSRWALKPTMRKGLLEEKVWQLVVEKPGYLVPGPVISNKLYGLSNTEELRATVCRGEDLKGNIEDRDALFVSIIGQGVGIDSLTPRSLGWIQPVYALWEDLGKFVHPEILFNKLYGRPIDQDSADALHIRYQRLGERVNFKSAVIEGADFNFDRYYRLRILDDQEPKSSSKKQKGLYNKEFQEWLAKAGVMPASDKYRKIELKEGEKFSVPQAKLVGLLNDKGHRIVPFDKITDIYYPDRPLPENWRERIVRNLYTLRSRLANPDSIFVASDLGWGFGIEALTLSKANLTLLYSLWERSNRFVDLETSSEEAGIEHVKRAVTDIRKGLAKSGNLIGSRHGPNGPEYMLTHRDDLVLPTAA